MSGESTRGADDAPTEGADEAPTEGADEAPTERESAETTSERAGGPHEGAPDSRAQEPTESRGGRFVREVLSGSFVVTVLAVVLGLLVGAVLIAFADSDVLDSVGYFFARPMDTFAAIWNAVADAYSAMFRGAIYDYQADTWQRAVRPFTETLVYATPLILAGLGLAIGFRAGLFNIGGQGQIILGGITGAYVGFAFDLPVVVHVLLAAIAAALGGAIWAGIAGVLKARTGANEVIVTIMLNSIATYFVAYLLTTQAFRLPNSPYPKSPDIAATAAYPLLLGPSFRLNAAFLVAIAAAVFAWWLLDRSTLGFEIRSAGANPEAARTAGVSVGRTVALTMIISGALCGLAGSSQVLGTEHALTAGVAASYGFDAITVALLGRSRPLGTFFAGILFGGLQAGGRLMESVTATPIDITLVVQSTIVLLIAAPPLVRAIFRLPAPGARARRRTSVFTPKGAMA